MLGHDTNMCRIMQNSQTKRQRKMTQANANEQLMELDANRPLLKGLRQGSPEAATLFAILIDGVLTKLCQKWKQNGHGLSFRKFGGNPLSVEELLRPISVISCILMSRSSF